MVDIVIIVSWICYWSIFYFSIYFFNWIYATSKHCPEKFTPLIFFWLLSILFRIYINFCVLLLKIWIIFNVLLFGLQYLVYIKLLINLLKVFLIWIKFCSVMIKWKENFDDFEVQSFSFTADWVWNLVNFTIRKGVSWNSTRGLAGIYKC